MAPIVLFGIQFTFRLASYALLAWWYLVPRLARLPRDLALVPLVPIHAFAIVGTMIGYGDMATAVLALVALIALRLHLRFAIALVWVTLTVGLLDTVNAIIESMRYSVFNDGLGVNWVIVTSYVPALLVSSVLIFIQLRRPSGSTT